MPSSNDDSILTTLSPHASSLLATLQTFITTSCIPAESTFDSSLPLDPARRFDSIPPILQTLQLEAKELGLWNLFITHEHNISVREYGILSEAMGHSFLCPSATNCAAPDTGNMEVLLEYGSDEQKRVFLKGLMDGSERSAFLMTEPEVASSDASNICCEFTKIVPDRGVYEGVECYCINGRKWWSTGAQDPRCTVFIVMGKVVDCNKSSSSSKNRHASHTMLVLPARTPGLKIERSLTVFNYDDAPFGHAEISLTDVIVPCELALLKEEGAGFAIAQSRLGPGRIHHCMRACGLGERVYSIMLQRITKKRGLFGKATISNFDHVEQEIAECYAKIKSARALTLLCADSIDRGGAKGSRRDISMIKYAVPNLLLPVVDYAIQVHGGGGLTEDQILAKSYAFLRTLRLADGPDEVHRRVVGRGEIKRTVDCLFNGKGARL